MIIDPLPPHVRISHICQYPPVIRDVISGLNYYFTYRGLNPPLRSESCVSSKEGFAPLHRVQIYMNLSQERKLLNGAENVGKKGL